MNNTCPTRDLERKEVPCHRDASGASLASPIDRGAGKCPCCGSDNTGARRQNGCTIYACDDCGHEWD